MSAALIADKLRASLLQAAIQGKLTKQLAEDGDARDLLKAIEAEKARLIEEKIIKKEKPLLPITDEEIPFEIPENWVWVRLGDVVLKNIGGGTPSKSNLAYWNGDIFWASVKDLNVDEIYETQDKITQEGLDNSSSNLIPKDTYVICTRMGLGKISLAQVDVAINQDLRALFFSKNFNKKYFYHFYKTLVFKGKGATVKGISVDQLNNYLFPLPPLAEQHRIVEAIETALAKIDKLKADETKLYDIQKAFPNKLRASLLQSAIQGQLTEQLPGDGNACDLLKEIEAEKARLIEEKVIKKEKPLPPITEDEIPFEIPGNWVWQKLSMISYTIPSKNYQILSKDVLEKGLYPVISQSQNYIDGYANNKDQVFTNIPIIIFGDHTKVIKLVDRPFIVGADGTKLIKPLIINIRYLEVVLQYHRINMHDRGYSRHFQFIKDSLIPIPPPAEQERIVKKLDEILGKVDELKKIAE